MELKYCLYARKSTEQDERQAMSISSQIKEMSELASREQLQIVTVKQESFSAKNSAARPIFNEMMQEIREGKYDAVLTWAPDRLARNAGDLGSLVYLMDEGKLQKIRTFGQSFANNPNEKFLLMILGSQAKLENDNRSINVKRGLRAKCETGWRPSLPPLGYYTRGSGNGRDVIVDELRAPYIKQMFEMSASGKSGRHIRSWLEDNKVTTRKEKHISLSMIYKILKNPYYYGKFEFPKKSGQWYKGSHEPLIAKNLYDKVQKQLTVPLKPKWGAKEFPYKNFLTCYSCGSSIVGEEKIKTRKDGSQKKFVYYHCSRQVEYTCTEPYAREEDIVEGLSVLCNELITDTSKLEPGLKIAMDKFMRMIRSTGGDTTTARGAYIRYVLREGTSFEKTRWCVIWTRNSHCTID
jgi:site-specific DNA recombinase